VTTTTPAPITITLPPAGIAEDRTTYSHMTGHEGGMWPAEECEACNGPISDGDPVRKVGDDWLDETCAVKKITAADGDAAWLILADLVTARPSAFRASDIRAVMSNVARIGRRAETVVTAPEPPAVTDVDPFMPAVYWSRDHGAVITRISPRAACIMWDGESTKFLAELPEGADRLVVGTTPGASGE
jgi:hypothetical protein